jgi:hypothetical protein
LLDFGLGVDGLSLDWKGFWIGVDGLCNLLVELVNCLLNSRCLIKYQGNTV